MLLQEPRRALGARDVSGSDTESLHSDVRDGVSEGDGEVEHTEETPAPPPVSLSLRSLGQSRRVEEFGRGRFGGNF